VHGCSDGVRWRRDAVTRLKSSDNRYTAPEARDDRSITEFG